MTKVAKKFTVIPDGIHQVKVMKAELGENDNGEYIVLNLAVQNNKDKSINGLEILKTLSLKKEADWATFPWIVALTGKTREEILSGKYQLDTDDLEGKTVTVEYVASDGISFPMVNLFKGKKE